MEGIFPILRAVIFENADIPIYFNHGSPGHEECFALNSAPDRMPFGRFPDCGLEELLLPTCATEIKIYSPETTSELTQYALCTVETN